MILEVIACNIEDIEIINKSNADRIEYCEELEKGGFTPKYEEILKINSKLPVNIMARNTDRDFIYTEDEFNQILKDIKFIGESKKANGVVFGFITADGKINAEWTKQAVELAKSYGLKITFHRAFEEVVDKEKGFEILCDLKVDYLLTSGGGKITDQLDVLASLKNKKGYTKILGGGGINKDNFDAVKNVVDEIHLGTLVREQNSFAHPANVDFINEYKSKM